MKQDNKEVLERMAMDYLKEAATQRGDDEDSKDESQENFNRGMKLVDKLKEFEEMELNAENVAEKIQVDRERTESQERTEKSKRDISKKQIAYDILKVVVTAGIPASVHYLTVRRCAKLEETGRWNTKASNMALNQEPKMFKDIRF